MEKDKATEEWLNSLKKNTGWTYKTYWKYFLEFTGLTGDQILAKRKADKEYTLEKQTLAFRAWIIKNKGLSEYTARSATNAVRGFFSYYRCPLKFRRTESARLSEARRQSEDYRFSVNDLKKMFEIANLKERYVIVAGKSFGLRAGDFLALTRGDLEPYIERSPPISIGKYSTQKESVSAFPFIDTDAKPIIKLMLENMERQGKTKPNYRILKFKNIIELSRILQRITKKAGIKIGNKRVRFHCLRKFLIDHLSSYMSESKWKQIVGKKISEGAYVSPDTLRADYSRAMVETTFHKTAEGNIEDIVRKRLLMEKAKELGFTDAEIAKHISFRTVKQQLDGLKTLLEKGSKRNDCDNGEHCGKQKIVTEATLSKHLQQGWRVVAALPSGNVVIER